MPWQQLHADVSGSERVAVDKFEFYRGPARDRIYDIPSMLDKGEKREISKKEKGIGIYITTLSWTSIPTRR